jgi:hypothetical protein
MEQTIEYYNGFKIINNVPKMTDEERDAKEKEILLKLYNLFFNKKK